MVVEENYDSQSFKTLSTLDNYEEYAMNNVLLFILHPEAVEHSLEWGDFEKENVKKYFLRQKYGGPTIDFYSPGIIEKRDKLIGPGFLSSHSFYYSGKEKLYPNEAYKDLFKKFSNYIKKNSVSVKLKKRTYWVGNNAINSCKENGYNFVEIGGFNILNLILKK